MQRYFAYGANIDAERMRSRVPGVRPVGPSRLDDYELEFTIRDREWGGGVANIRPRPGACVWGMLWEGPEESYAVLDTYRGDEDLLRKETVTVQGPDGDVKAFTFRVHQIANPVRPSKLYLAHLRRAIERAGLPNAAFEAVLRAQHQGPDDDGPSIVS